MARKPSGIDKKLLAEGKSLIIKKGVSALSIRDLTDRAGVNLGMFNYYFKTKDKFVELILNEVYSDFLLELDSTENKEGLEKLREQMFVIAKFARDNRSLILSSLNDVLSEEKVVKKFVRTKMKKHLVILGKTVLECKNKGLLIEAPLPLIITQIIGVVGLSNLIPELLKRLNVGSPFNMAIKELTKKLTSDESLLLRIDILLKGLSA